MSIEEHWSETLGDWFFAGTVSDHYDWLLHDVEQKDHASEVEGMFLLHRDGRSEPAPTTLAAWSVLADLADEDEVVCVGRVVDGMCVPIGRDDEGDE